MRVKLRVLHGANAGREVKIPVSQFLIGRDDACQLRPRSDLISRKHCVIRIGETGVVVRDLKSRNGTFVNDEKVEGDRELKLGDRLRVGKVEFEVLIDHGLAGTKKPVVKNVKEAVARTVEKEAKGGEEDIDGWLEEADEVDRAQKLTDPDTRQYKLDETERVLLEKAEAAKAAQAGKSADSKADDEADATTDTISGADVTEEDTKVGSPKTKKKREFGKLPDVPNSQSENSRDAAAQVLKDFFNRR